MAYQLAYFFWRIESYLAQPGFSLSRDSRLFGQVIKRLAPTLSLMPSLELQ